MPTQPSICHAYTMASELSDVRCYALLRMQILFISTPDKWGRRGLAKLLVSSIRELAVLKAGHQAITASVVSSAIPQVRAPAGCSMRRHAGRSMCPQPSRMCVFCRRHHVCVPASGSSTCPQPSHRCVHLSFCGIMCDQSCVLSHPAGLSLQVAA